MSNAKRSETQPKRRRVMTLPTLRVDITLNTDFAQRVYRRVWDRLKADIYILTVRSRAVGRDDIAETSEQLLRDQFKKLQTDLSADIERADILLDKLGITELGQYGGAVTKVAEYTTPQAKQYLDLVLSMDQLIMRLDALWLNGEIETKACKVRSHEWKRRIVKLANRIRQISSSGRRTLDAAYAERQRAKAEATSSGSPMMEEGGEQLAFTPDEPGEDDAAGTIGSDPDELGQVETPAVEDDEVDESEAPVAAASG